MAITRTDVNGDLTVLKTALESLGWFASVTLDDPSSPTTLTCKDDDNNILLEWYKSSSSYGAKAFKDSTHFIGSAAVSGNLYNPQYFYKVGDNGAVIKSNSVNNFFIIAKTHDDKIGFVFPHDIAISTFDSTYWGDDISLTDYFLICNPSTSNYAVGNHCLFVKIPVHGTYNEAVEMPKAFFIAMAQPNMRNVVQEITGGLGVYLTNGYLALLDDGSAT